MMRGEHKKGRKNGFHTTISVHIGIDTDLYERYKAIPNKTRFINDAIREKLQRDLADSLKTATFANVVED